jgi:hypothetical protein
VSFEPFVIHILTSYESRPPLLFSLSLSLYRERGSKNEGDVVAGAVDVRL